MKIRRYLKCALVLTSVAASGAGGVTFAIRRKRVAADKAGGKPVEPADAQDEEGDVDEDEEEGDDAEPIDAAKDAPKPEDVEAMAFELLKAEMSVPPAADQATYDAAVKAAQKPIVAKIPDKAFEAALHNFLKSPKYQAEAQRLERQQHETQMKATLQELVEKQPDKLEGFLTHLMEAFLVQAGKKKEDAAPMAKKAAQVLKKLPKEEREKLAKDDALPKWVMTTAASVPDAPPAPQGDPRDDEVAKLAEKDDAALVTFLEKHFPQIKPDLKGKILTAAKQDYKAKKSSLKTMKQLQTWFLSITTQVTDADNKARAQLQQQQQDQLQKQQALQKAGANPGGKQPGAKSGAAPEPPASGAKSTSGAAKKDKEEESGGCGSCLIWLLVLGVLGGVAVWYFFFFRTEEDDDAGSKGSGSPRSQPSSGGAKRGKRGNSDERAPLAGSSEPVTRDSTRGVDYSIGKDNPTIPELPSSGSGGSGNRGTPSIPEDSSSPRAGGSRVSAGELPPNRELPGGLHAVGAEIGMFEKKRPSGATDTSGSTIDLVSDDDA